MLLIFDKIFCRNKWNLNLKQYNISDMTNDAHLTKYKIPLVHLGSAFHYKCYKSNQILTNLKVSYRHMTQQLNTLQCKRFCRLYDFTRFKVISLTIIQWDMSVNIIEIFWPSVRLTWKLVKKASFSFKLFLLYEE